MRSVSGVFIFLALILLLDIYVFSAVRAVTASLHEKTKSWVFLSYWSVTLLSCLGLLIYVLSGRHRIGHPFWTYLVSVIIGLFLTKLLVSFFLVIDDIRRLFQWTLQQVFTHPTHVSDSATKDDHISRSVFVSWLGLAAGSTLFGSLLYGFRNQYKYRIVTQKLSFPHLPASFKGLKIVHISDIHSGSFMDQKAVAHGIDLINQQQADLILFTGDLVNDRAVEMNPYIDMFSRIRAPLGVYATLGNHDYGDYVQWPIDGVSKQQNLEDLKQVYQKMNWRLLMNEHVVLEKQSDKIALLGIENWSAKARFPKYGKLDLAYAGTDQYPFKILMSHDPSHWHRQVRPEYPDIDLTLSGHTHGMQFGVEIPGFKWSPVQYVYKEWAGLYEEAGAKLYVNRGFGCIGYPGRVGVLPEITVIELV